MHASTKVVLIAAGLGVTAYVLYRSFDQVGRTAASVGAAVNPLNPDNVFASATNKVGAVLTGDDSFSLGGWLYDVTHPEEAAAVSAAPTPIASSFGGWTSDNVISGAVNKVGAAVSGDDSFSLGGWLYDVTHPSSGWDVVSGATPSAPLGQIGL